MLYLQLSFYKQNSFCAAVDENRGLVLKKTNKRDRVRCNIYSTITICRVEGVYNIYKGCRKSLCLF